MCCFVCVVCACGVVCGCVVLACCREHVVVLVVRVCVCGVCGVLFFLCVCTCGVGEAWHAENPPVCTFKTPPCVRRRFERTHRGVFISSSLLFSFLLDLSFSSSLLLSCLSSYMSLSLFFLLFSLFSFLLYLLFHLLFLHTQRRDQTDK